MIEFRKMCGKRNVRRSTRMIAYLHFFLNSLFIFVIVVKYFDNWSSQATVIEGLRKNYGHDNDFEEMEYELSVFSRITASALVMVASVYLRSATFAHNLPYIKFFMVLQFFDLVTTFMTYVVASIRISGAELFTIGLLVFALKSYMMRVVYKFYVEEVITAKSLSIQSVSTANNSSIYGVGCCGP